MPYLQNNEIGFQDSSFSSLAAALEIMPSQNSIKGKVYHYILSCGDRGATTEEIANGLGISYRSVQPRTSEMQQGKKKLIYDTGGVRRSKETGKFITIWKVIGT